MTIAKAILRFIGGVLLACAVATFFLLPWLMEN